MQGLSGAMTEQRSGLVALVRANPPPLCVRQHPPLTVPFSQSQRSADGTCSTTPRLAHSPEPQHDTEHGTVIPTMRGITTRDVDVDQSCPPLIGQSPGCGVPPSSGGRTSTFPLIDVAGLVQSAARQQRAPSSTSPRKHSAPLPTLKMDGVSKDTLSMLLSPALQRSSGGGSRRQTPGERVARPLPLGAGNVPTDARPSTSTSTQASRSASVTSTAALSAMALHDPDCEMLTHESGGDMHSSKRPPTAISFSGVGVSAMSASVEKDLMMTENIVRRLVDEYAKKHRSVKSRWANGAVQDDVHLDDMFTASVMSVSKAFEAVVGQLEGGHAAAMHQRQQRLHALAAPHHTRIPKQYWITRDPMPTSAPSKATTSGDGTMFQVLHDGNRVLAFPSPTPGNRPEVYLLARTLDELLTDTVPQRDVLTNPTIAYAILPSDVTARNVSETEAVRQQYVHVARAFFEVLDVGLSEVARQVAPSCPERAAVIDRIRQAYDAVHGTCFDIVAHCKERAFEEALRRQEYDDIITTKNRQIIDGLAKVASLETRVLELEKEIETNATKAARFDELVSRMDVREQQRQRAIVRADQLEVLDDADDAVSKASLLANAVFENLNNSASASQRPVESTAARLERLRRDEEERGQMSLYDASVRLMRTLRETVSATDAACAPFYDRMIFGTPELNTTVAAGKWSAIGKAIGEHEAIWDHRERVARAHAIWLEVMTTKANARSRRGGGVGGQRPGGASTSNLGTGGDVSDEEGSKTPTTTSNTSLLQFDCDVDQLRAMGVTDVTPDEIMMMQHPDFDMEAFLHPSQRIPARWGMSNAGVAQMLADVQTTFQEVSVRLNALKESGLLADIARPPLMPPSRPADPCGLCGRRDGVELEKRHHRAFVDNVVKEMHAREEDALVRVEEARAERDALQLQLDAQHEACRKLEQRLDMLETLRPQGPDGDDDHPTSLSSHGTLIAPSELPPPVSLQPILNQVACDPSDSSRSGGHPSEDVGNHADGAPATRRKTSTTVRRRSSITSRASNTSSQASAAATPGAPGLVKVQRTASSSPLNPQSSSQNDGRRSASEHSNEGSSSHSEHHPTQSGSRRNSRTSKRKSSSGALSRSRGGSMTLGTSDKQASLAASGTAAETRRRTTGGNGNDHQPLVIKLVINCRCCGAEASSTTAQKQHSSSSLLEAPTVITESSDAVGGGRTELSSYDALMNYRIPHEDLVEVPSSTLRHVHSNLASPPKRPGTVEPSRPKNTPVDDGSTAANDVTQGDSDFALAPPHLSSFVGAPDPVISHTKSMGRLLAVNSTATLRPGHRSASATATGTSGCYSDTYGDADDASFSPFGGSSRNASPLVLDEDDDGQLPPPVRAVLETAVPGANEVEGDSSTFVVERTLKARGQGGGAWAQMEDKVMHRLKSIEISRVMAATVRPPPLNATQTDTAVTAAAQGRARGTSKAPKPPSSARSTQALRLGLTQRHQITTAPSSASARAATNPTSAPGVVEDIKPAGHDPVGVLGVSSGAALRQIVAASEDHRIDAAFKSAVQALRHTILRLSGRIETLQRSSVRTLGWLLKYIGNFYRAKRQADATAEHEGHAYATAQAFLATFLKRQLGASEIVYEHLHYIYASCKAYRDVDLRVKQFMRVLFLYDIRTTSFFLQVSLLLEQCGVGLDYSATHNSFAMDDGTSALACMCFRRVAACLTESGLHQRRYAPLLWKALSHRTFAAEVADDTFFASLRKAGMEAEAVQRRPPSTWSAEDVGMMRVVVLKSALLTLICFFEMADASGAAAEPLALHDAGASAAGTTTDATPATAARDRTASGSGAIGSVIAAVLSAASTGVAEVM